MLKKLATTLGILFIILFIYFSFYRDSVYYLILRLMGSTLILVLIFNYIVQKLREKHPTKTFEEFVKQELDEK